MLHVIQIKLKYDEYITNISGSIGKWHQNVDVTKLMIHTNFNQDGYGPYGGGPHTAYLSNFRSQVPSAGRVVGFFGTLHNNYVQSIGLYVNEVLYPLYYEGLDIKLSLKLIGS